MHRKTGESTHKLKSARMHATTTPCRSVTAEFTLSGEAPSPREFVARLRSGEAPSSSGVPPPPALLNKDLTASVKT